MKRVIFLLLTAVCLFCFCSENQKNTVNTDDMEREARLKLYDIAEKMYNASMERDSNLLADEEKLFAQQVDALSNEGYVFIDGRFEVINKEEFKKFGMPDIYYIILKKDIDRMNAYFDTIPKQEKDNLIEMYLKQKEEYLKKKEEETMQLK